MNSEGTLDGSCGLYVFVGGVLMCWLLNRMGFVFNISVEDEGSGESLLGDVLGKVGRSRRWI